MNNFHDPGRRLVKYVGIACDHMLTVAPRLEDLALASQDLAQTGCDYDTKGSCKSLKAQNAGKSFGSGRAGSALSIPAVALGKRQSFCSLKTVLCEVDDLNVGN